LKADVRLITATNRDVERVLRDGRFRTDLYYRLAVFRIHLPALREREGDVLILAEHFLRKLAERMGRSKAGLTEQARQLLLVHSWPGNIRELQNAIERALIVADGELISGAHLGILEPAAVATASLSRSDAGVSSAPLTQPLAEVERQSVVEALRRAKGNKSNAATALGLSRGALYGRRGRFGRFACRLFQFRPLCSELANALSRFRTVRPPIVSAPSRNVSTLRRFFMRWSLVRSVPFSLCQEAQAGTHCAS